MSPQRSTLRLFLSSNTQDFIEVGAAGNAFISRSFRFLSSNTQDFIEVSNATAPSMPRLGFLSSNTQDFIEVFQTGCGLDLRENS